jgi:IclR family transcriptional regulator, pca regulon regulatory protein
VPDEGVRALSRGLAVIRALGNAPGGRTLSDVARDTELPRAAARRFLHSLVELEYARTDGKLFALTPRVLELGHAYLSGFQLADVAQPHLEALSAEVGESCSVSVLDGSDVVYVARSAVSRLMTVGISVGTRFPAYATSMGRVLLAELPPAALDAYLAATPLTALTPRTETSAAELRAVLDGVRRTGWCVLDQELEIGLRSVAAPLRDRTGTVVAAANISTAASRTTLDSVRRRLLPPLLRTCTRIEGDVASLG